MDDDGSSVGMGWVRRAERAEAELKRLQPIIDAADHVRCTAIMHFGPSLDLSDELQAAVAVLEEVMIGAVMSKKGGGDGSCHGGQK